MLGSENVRRDVVLSLEILHTMLLIYIADALQTLYMNSEDVVDDKVGVEQGVEARHESISF